MTENLGNESQEYEAHQAELNESVDGGGCTETWEALSEKRAGPDDTDGDSPDVEAVLVETDCLQFTDDGEDFELVPSFRQTWRSTIEDLDEEALDAVIADVFDVDGSIEIEAAKQAVHASHDGRLLGQWVSRPAMVADLAACRVLSDRDDDWEARSPGERSRFAGGLRLYIEFCPDCGALRRSIRRQ